MKVTVNNPNAVVSDAAEIEIDWSSPGYQAFRILQLGFVAAPILAGLDKFFHLLVNWDQYVPGFVAQLSPIGVHELMFAVGVIEIVAGVGVAWKPRIFAYVVAAWLLVIIANLLLIPGYFDVALRDFGLFLGRVGARAVEPAICARLTPPRSGRIRRLNARIGAIKLRRHRRSLLAIWARSGCIHEAREGQSGHGAAGVIRLSRASRIEFHSVRKVRSYADRGSRSLAAFQTWLGYHLLIRRRKKMAAPVIVARRMIR